MAYKENQKDNMGGLPLETEKEKEELYLYSLRKMAEVNVESNRIPITQMYNLRAFLYKVGELVREYPEKKFAMIVLDIANFKTVNEFCGRAAGDSLLIAIAKGLRQYEKEDTVLSHFRADVFGLFLSFTEEQELVDITISMSKIIAQVSLACKVLPAFGIYVATDPTMPPSLMIDYATLALNTIKGKFYANYAFFDSQMRLKMLMEKQIENDIVTALETGQFTVYIQPKVNMKSGEIVGGEALIRWQHPERGIIPPMDFIPCLERNGFIINVDLYVWNEVFQLQGRRLREGKKTVPISVNISRLHAYQKGFRDSLCQLSKQYEVPPKYVLLELTESGFLEGSEVMFERMQEIRLDKFSISMDDFGTGYSTMTMLRNQPVDQIKLDRGFIEDMQNSRSRIIARHTINMLKELGVHLLAEGVETKEQQDFLLECGCTEAQGFFYYKPMPSEEFETLLDKK